MSTFDSVGGLAQGFAGSLLSGLAGQIFGLSKAERQQNEYNAFEAQKSREFQESLFREGNAFNAEQAQLNRDFQAYQSATQFQRSVMDMRNAGLNPALAYGQGGASAMQGASASASSAPGPAQASGSGRGVQSSLSEMLQAGLFAKQLEKLDSEIKYTDAQRDLATKQSEYKGLEIAFFEPLTSAQLKQYDSALQTQAVERRLKESGIGVNEAQKLLYEKNAVLAGIDAETRGYLNSLEARQRVAQIGLTYQNTAESRRRVELINAEIIETLQRAVTEAAQAGLYDQQTQNLLIESGILQYDADIKGYQASKKKLTYVLDSIGKVVGAVGSAATTFGAIGVGARAFSGMSSVVGQSLKGAGLQYAPANSFNPYLLR